MKLSASAIFALLTTAISVQAYSNLYQREAFSLDERDLLEDELYARDLDLDDVLYKRELYERALDRIYARGVTSGGNGGFNPDGTMYVNPRPQPGKPLGPDHPDRPRFPGAGQTIGNGPQPMQCEYYNPPKETDSLMLPDTDIPM